MKEIEDFLSQAIEEGIFPCAAYAVTGRNHRWFGAVGHHTYCPDSPLVQTQTVFDLASVSKVVATTTLAMRAFDRRLFALDHTVASVIPEFATHGKEAITFRNLLVHDSGLIAFRPYHRTCDTREEVLAKIYEESLNYPRESKMVYSDLNMILLAEALERLDGRPVEQQFREDVAMPFGLTSTGYFRLGESTAASPVLRVRCCPTERTEEWRIALRKKRHGLNGSVGLYGHDPEYIQMEVHDPTATAIGGVAGHAGLFSTVEDLTKFMKLLTSGSLCERETYQEFTRRQSEKSSRGLGWDTKSVTGSSAGTKFGPRSFGHTGYTGTSVWHDPDADLTAILLTNRVHPTSENTKIIQFRPKFHDFVVSLLDK